MQFLKAIIQQLPSFQPRVLTKDDETVSHMMETMDIETTRPQQDNGDPDEAYSQHSFH